MFKNLKNIDWTRTMFLVPILLVAGISISHVVAWYDMANPYNWAIYLSVAIEVGAMTSLVAATKRIKGGVWFMFGIVTFIQVLGNIFYSYANISESDVLFQKWIELTSPIFEAMGTDPGDIIPHKRWLALLEGGLLPLISLTSLHFYTKYEKSNDQASDQVNDQAPTKPKEPELPKIIQEPNTDQETISVIPSNEPVGPLVEDDKPLGKYDMKFGPEYTKMMDEMEEGDDDSDEEIEIIEEQQQPKKIYNNVLDVDVQDEADDEIIEEELPIPEQERQKHLKFRKRLIAKEEEVKKTEEEGNTENTNHRRIEFLEGGKKAIIYPKRDKITQKKIG